MKSKQLVEPKSSGKLSRRVHFEYPAPSAGAVFLAGTFNNWDPQAYPLRKEEGGMWRTALSLSRGRYEYLYVVDGAWECDPNPKECVPNPFGSWNCVLTVQ